MLNIWVQSKIELSGGSSAGRASAFQAECRVFDSRPPLQTWFILKEKPLIFQSFLEIYNLSTTNENLTPLFSLIFPWTLFNRSIHKRESLEQLLYFLCLIYWIALFEHLRECMGMFQSRFSTCLPVWSHDDSEIVVRRYSQTPYTN